MLETKTIIVFGMDEIATLLRQGKPSSLCFFILLADVTIIYYHGLLDHEAEGLHRPWVKSAV